MLERLMDQGLEVLSCSCNAGRGGQVESTKPEWATLSVEYVGRSALQTRRRADSRDDLYNATGQPRQAWSCSQTIGERLRFEQQHKGPW